MNALKLENKPKILFVDDEQAILNSIKRFARGQAWSASFASSALEALGLLMVEDVAVIVCDMRMPNMNGAEFLKKAREVQPNATRILLSGFSDVADVRNVINEAGIFNYMIKPWIPEALQTVLAEAIAEYEAKQEQITLLETTKVKSKTLGKIALLLDKKSKERGIEVEQAMTLVDCIHAQMQTRLKESVRILNQIIDWKEGRDARHTRFVTKYAEVIANKMNLNDDVDDIVVAAMLHRVGMVGMPDRFSQEPYYSLSAEDKALYDNYPILGEQALAQSNNLRAVAKLIRHHKEYADGSGKPDALHFKQTPVGAQIIGMLSDFFELVLGRFDKAISGVDAALLYLEQWAGKKYDRSIHKIFIDVFDPDCDELSGSIMLNSAKLEDGMFLEQNVYSKAGAILLSKGSRITPAIITKIMSFEDKGAEYIVRIEKPENTEKPDGSEVFL